ISAERFSKAVKAKPLQPCGLAGMARETGSKASCRDFQGRCGRDARCFAVLLRAWPRGMTKTQCQVSPRLARQVSAAFETGSVRKGSGHAAPQSFGERQH